MRYLRGAKLVFSAHGVSPAVWQKAKEKQVEIVIDATCPLVEKVHREVRKFAAQGYWIILIGHESHDEIVGTSGEAPERIRIVADVEDARAVDIPDPDKVVVLTQTTLSVDDTREVIDCLEGKISAHDHAGQRGHLLCNPKPTGRRKATGWGSRFGSGDRIA